MAETGMRVRLQLLGGGPIEREFWVLDCLLDRLRRSTADILKEAYAGSLGLQHTERHRGPQGFRQSPAVGDHIIVNPTSQFHTANV
jgi:hypothetical protein